MNPLEWALANSGLLAMMLFAVCFIASESVKTLVRRSNNPASAAAIRRQYKWAWAAWVLEQEDLGPTMTFFRNNVTISASLLGGLLIAFGFVINAYSSFAGSQLGAFQFILLIGLLSYAFLNLLIEVRTLMYIPVILGAPETLIRKYEKMDKKEYVGRLLDHAYDDFSNAERALFYSFALMVFFFSTPLFVFGTLVLTWLLVRRDLSNKSRISIY